MCCILSIVALFAPVLKLRNYTTFSNSNKHMAEEKQEGQKTVVSFVVGLLIGGLLVWAFSGPTSEAPTSNDGDDTKTEETTKTDDESMEGTDDSTVTEAAPEAEVKPTLSVGDGKIVVNDQPASSAIMLESATYPVSEGWVGVRTYENDQLGYILGVVRFSEEQGLVPNQIVLQRPTTAGKQYAVVVYKENGDLEFNLAKDVQIDTIFATFTAK